MSNEDHWNTIYTTKRPDEVSWTQDRPNVSLQLIDALNLPKSAKIIDIGGGDSNLVDFLLANGYTDITVLDISEKALERTKLRLGSKADSVHWIVSDMTTFQPTVTYDLWHDRAAFHFLRSPQHIENYVARVNSHVRGHLIMGTFSIQGPLKCSGLDICQYDAQKLTNTFSDNFEMVECFTTDHLTPFKTLQNFQFCYFRKQV